MGINIKWKNFLGGVIIRQETERAKPARKIRSVNNYNNTAEDDGLEFVVITLKNYEISLGDKKGQEETLAEKLNNIKNKIYYDRLHCVFVHARGCQ